MINNPFDPPSNAPSAPQRSSSLSGLRYVAVSASAVLCLLGCAVAALIALASDASGFFLVFGVHLIASGLLGAVSELTKGPTSLKILLRLMSFIVNSALLVRITMLAFEGTIRGPLVVVAPLLLGVPALLNLAAAVSGRQDGPPKR